MSPEEQAQSELQKIVRNIKQAGSAKAVLKEAEALPESIRCHIALALDDLLREDILAFRTEDVTIMETASGASKADLSARAATVAAVAQFIADNKGIAPCLPVKIIADNALADAANPLAALIKSAKEIMALREETKDIIRDLVAAADDAALTQVFSDINKFPEQGRIFIAEALEREFHSISKDIQNGGDAKTRQQGKEKAFAEEGGDITLRLLTFIIKTKGADTAPFTRLLAEGISRFRQDSHGKTLVDVFQEASLQANNWPQERAAGKEKLRVDTQDSIDRQREKLAKLRSRRPTLKKKTP